MDGYDVSPPNINIDLDSTRILWSSSGSPACCQPIPSVAPTTDVVMVQQRSPAYLSPPAHPPQAIYKESVESGRRESERQSERLYRLSEMIRDLPSNLILSILNWLSRHPMSTAHFTFSMAAQRARFFIRTCFEPTDGGPMHSSEFGRKEGSHHRMVARTLKNVDEAIRIQLAQFLLDIRLFLPGSGLPVVEDAQNSEITLIEPTQSILNPTDHRSSATSAAISITSTTSAAVSITSATSAAVEQHHHHSVSSSPCGVVDPLSFVSQPDQQSEQHQDQFLTADYQPGYLPAKQHAPCKHDQSVVCHVQPVQGAASSGWPEEMGCLHHLLDTQEPAEELGSGQDQQLKTQDEILKEIREEVQQFEVPCTVINCELGQKKACKDPSECGYIPPTNDDIMESICQELEGPEKSCPSQQQQSLDNRWNDLTGEVEPMSFQLASPISQQLLEGCQLPDQLVRGSLNATVAVEEDEGAGLYRNEASPALLCCSRPESQCSRPESPSRKLNVEKRPPRYKPYTAEEWVERKKEQDRLAATRYRNRKKENRDRLLKEMKEAEDRQAFLKEEEEDLQKQINAILKFMHEMFGDTF